MNGFKDVITNEFTSRFKPNEIVVSTASFNFFTTPSDEGSDVKEPVRMTTDVVSEIGQIDGVNTIEPIMLVNGMQIKIKGEERAFSPSFIVGTNLAGDSNFFAGFEGDNPSLEDGESFVSEDVVNFFQITNEEIIGKTVIFEASAGGLLGSQTKGQIGKSYEFEIIGVVDTGADRTDAVVSINEAANILAINGGFESGEEYLAEAGFDQLFVTANSEDDLEYIKTTIKDNYGLQTFSADDVLEFLNLITTGITFVLIFFGLVSAVVASIGIINTMVMSIYEQTREIGINKAVGASNLQIMSIFLIQSGVIGLIGGLLGLAIVLGVTTLSDPFVVQLLQDQGFSAEKYFTFDMVIVAGIVIGCIVVGIIAGIYPAIKAARLDPVKALRFE
jgi:putative ABC transport system permease protein